MLGSGESSPVLMGKASTSILKYRDTEAFSREERHVVLSNICDGDDCYFLKMLELYLFCKRSLFEKNLIILSAQCFSN